MSSGNSSRNHRDNLRNDEEEEAMNHHGYYDEEELDIDRLREQIFEGAANSNSHNAYRELFRHGARSDSQDSARINPYRLQAVTSSANHQRRLIYGEEDDEDEDDRGHRNHYDVEDDEEEDEDRLGTAA